MLKKTPFSREIEISVSLKQLSVKICTPKYFEACTSVYVNVRARNYLLVA